jgi:hypothetical protein
MKDIEKAPRKGSAEWVMESLMQGGELVGSRGNAALPWYYALHVHGVTFPVTETRILKMLHDRLLKAELDPSWNKIVYRLVPQQAQAA